MLSKSAARAFFLGGTFVCAAVFIGLTVDTLGRIPEQTKQQNLTESVKQGKKLWEKNNCMGCHTILGEGAYFAPEVGNVLIRWGGDKDMKGAKETLKAWMKSQPSGVAGRRQMPNFNLTDKEIDDLGAFFEWVTKINTQKWPPKASG